jgi:hypothetical protein
LSYLTLFEPKIGLNKKNQYSVTLLFPKDGEGTHCPGAASEIAQLKDALKAFASEQFGAANLKGIKLPFKDGDIGVDGKDPAAPGYWYLRTASNADYPPKLIDGHKNPVTGGWKSGDWGVANISFWSYNRDDGKGVSVNILGMQFLYHDEALGGGAKTASVDDFETVTDAHKPEAGAASTQDGGEYDPFADE